MSEHRFWQERYASKVLSAEQAIRTLRPGRRLLIGSGAAEPTSLVQALVEHGEHLADNEIVHLLTLGPAPYVEPRFAQRFRHTAFFIGANVRAAVQEGRADFMPVFLSEIPELIRRRRVRVDVALVQVSPPDAHGYVSLGVSVDVVRAAVESAERVIAEVNPHMPRTAGDSFVHVRDIHALVPVDVPLPELSSEPPDPTCTEIGRHIARLIPDGATLQVGIGRIPDAVLAELGGRRDLGIHTEMLSDGVMRLWEQGAITGRRKSLLPGKMVTSFVMGSRALYEWVRDNPAIEMRPSDFTNDPAVVARNERMMAINSALAVDLTGQVAADSVKGAFFSGIGGQVDFIRGAARSKEGKPIIALPSTAKKGTVSRIQAELDAGVGVVTSRGDVHYVVTEYGVADLWGRSVRERALALVSIAHPHFREELLAHARQRRFVFLDQALPCAHYPWSQQSEVRLEDGAELVLRPARLTDERGIQALLYRLSDPSVYQRFLGFQRAHPHEEVQSLVNFDEEANMAFVAHPRDSDELIGMARYDVDPSTRLADVAFVVRDDWQGKGLGTQLLKKLQVAARARGLQGFTADVRTTNKPMLGIFNASGLKVRSRREDGLYHLELLFDDGGASAREP